MGGGFVQDRSIYEDTGIFAQMHADQGTMSATDFETYSSLFEAMVMTPYFPHPDLSGRQSAIDSEPDYGTWP